MNDSWKHGGEGSSHLELLTYEVKDAAMDHQTALQAGTLTINAVELRSLLLEDSYFDDVVFDVVRPGEDARLVHIIDVVEPRTRVSEPGSDFPGLLGAFRTVGRGTTHRLGGICITEVSEPVPGAATLWREAMLDMSGAGAQYSPLSRLINLVVEFRPNLERLRQTESADKTDTLAAFAAGYDKAIRLAGLKAAVYLASITAGLRPDRRETLRLAENDSLRALPGVVYLLQLQATYLYGEILPPTGSVGEPGPLPTIIHPNEVLDGALVNAFTTMACTREATYLMQNHAVIRELHRRHGESLDFRGVVLYTYGENNSSKERVAGHTANLADLLGANGAILSSLGGGHATIDLMLTCEKLERRGIATTLLLPEMATDPEDSGFVHFVREAQAIVSTGNYEQRVQLEPTGKVIGGMQLIDGHQNASGSLDVPLRLIIGSTNQWGASQLRGRAR